MGSPVPATAAMLVLTLLMGAAVYFAVDMHGLDPLGLFHLTSAWGPAARGPREPQEAALEALVSALEQKDGSGDSGKKAPKKDASAMYEEMVLDELVSSRKQKQQRARQHAQATVAAVVEEMTHEVNRDKESDKDKDPAQKEKEGDSTQGEGIEKKEDRR